MDPRSFSTGTGGGTPYARQHVDTVVALHPGCQPEAAVPAPLLLQDDYQTFVVFNAVTETASGYAEPAGLALVEFKGCLCTQFGYPNDEALRGHPLYDRGLSEIDTGFFEVHGSSWVTTLETQSRVAFPATRRWNLRHYGVLFHESTLECIAEEMQIVLTREPRSDVVRLIVERMAARHAPAL